MTFVRTTRFDGVCDPTKAVGQRAGRVAYGPEHLLIGLLRTNERAGFQMLGSLGVGIDAVRARRGEQV